MKCIKCGGITKKTQSSRTIKGKVVGPIMISKCQKCGAEYLPEKEYEKVLEKMENTKTKTKMIFSTTQ